MHCQDYFTVGHKNLKLMQSNLGLFLNNFTLKVWLEKLYLAYFFTDLTYFFTDLTCEKDLKLSFLFCVEKTLEFIFLINFTYLKKDSSPLCYIWGIKCAIIFFCLSYFSAFVMLLGALKFLDRYKSTFFNHSVNISNSYLDKILGP